MATRTAMNAATKIASNTKVEIAMPPAGPSGFPMASMVSQSDAPVREAGHKAAGNTELTALRAVGGYGR
jgi:hypothetical protein